MSSTDIPKKIILVGDVGVGKTSLIMRFTDGACDEQTVATCSFDFKQKQLTVGKKSHMLHIWDTAGQERFGTITSSVYRKAKGVAYVYDVTREETFTNLKQWMQEVTQKYNEVQTSNIVIVGNKCDQPAKVPLEIAQKFADDNNALFIQTSARTGDNVEAIFTALAKGLEERSGSTAEAGPERLRGNTSTVIRRKSRCTIL